jgi:hypothetical protein
VATARAATLRATIYASMRTPPANVEDGAGRRQVTQEDLLRAGELDQPVAAEQTPIFDAPVIVGLCLARYRLAHSRIPFRSLPV